MNTGAESTRAGMDDAPQPGPARPSSWSRRLERGFKRSLARALAGILRPRPLPAGAVRDLPVRNLLVIRQHNQMGDMVLALPALETLRRVWPQAHLTFLTGPLCQELLEEHPGVDRLLVYHKQDMWWPHKLWRFLRAVRDPRPDLAVVLGTVSFSTTSALLAWASGAPVRIGASSRPFGSDLSRAVYHLELPDPPEGVHEVEHNLAPLRALGLPVPAGPPHLEAREALRRAVAARLAKAFPHDAAHAPLVVLHVGAGKRPNLWPAAQFVRVGTALVEQVGARLVLTEGPGDADVVEDVIRRLPGEALRWRERLPAAVALFEHADLVIANDTGMAHVAAAAGAPVIVLFGPTDVQRWCPAGPHVVPIVSPTRRMIDLDAARVLDTAHAMLAQAQRDAAHAPPHRARHPLAARRLP